MVGSSEEEQGAQQLQVFWTVPDVEVERVQAQVNFPAPEGRNT